MSDLDDVEVIDNERNREDSPVTKLQELKISEPQDWEAINNEDKEDVSPPAELQELSTSELQDFEVINNREKQEDSPLVELQEPKIAESQDSVINNEIKQKDSQLSEHQEPEIAKPQDLAISNETKQEANPHVELQEAKMELQDMEASKNEDNQENSQLTGLQEPKMSEPQDSGATNNEHKQEDSPLVELQEGGIDMTTIYNKIKQQDSLNADLIARQDALLTYVNNVNVARQQQDSLITDLMKRHDALCIYVNNLNAAHEQEKKSTEKLRSMLVNINNIQLSYHQNILIRAEQLEYIYKQYKERNLESYSGFEPPLFFGNANIMRDLYVLDYTIENMKFRKPHIVMGIKIIFGLDAMQYRKPPVEMWKILDAQADMNHMDCYKEVLEKEKFAALKSACDAIVDLWKNHIDQSIEYPADEIEARIDEFDELREEWELLEGRARSCVLKAYK